MLADLILHSFPALAVSISVALVLTLAFARIQQNRKIKALGGRAKVLPTKSLGINNVLTTVKYAKADRNRELWEERIVEYGTHTLEMEVLTQRIILSTDPENIKAVLATQFHDYGKGENFHDSWFEFLGDSIFTTDGKQWQESRALIRTQFMKDRIADLHTFERHLQHMFSHFPTDGSPINISDWVFRFTLDTGTDFIFGETVNSIANAKVEFSRAFADVQEHMNLVTRVGPFRHVLSKSKFRKDLKVLNAFVEPFVERTLSMSVEDLKGKKDNEYNFLHALAQYTRDPRMLRDQLVAVLIAARDTTAGTLAWCFYELSKKPQVVKKIRTEVLNKLGPDGIPTYSDLKEMKYVMNVINETLRLYPAVPFNIRVALKDTTLPRGNVNNENEPVGMPAGTAFAYSPMVMQRRADIFGEDVLEFSPERWEGRAPKSWQYIPFNGGPRICVGQQFALTQMQYFLARMFQRYETVESAMGPDHRQFERCEITIAPGNDVKVFMKPAKYD